jgi:hypothetical protein
MDVEAGTPSCQDSLQQSTARSSDRSFFGLWSQNICVGLLQPVERPKAGDEGMNVSRRHYALCWLWASVTGEISYRGICPEEEGPHSEALELHCEPAGANAYGPARNPVNVQGFHYLSSALVLLPGLSMAVCAALHCMLHCISCKITVLRTMIPKVTHKISDSANGTCSAEVSRICKICRGDMVIVPGCPTSPDLDYYVRPDRRDYLPALPTVPLTSHY